MQKEDEMENGFDWLGKWIKDIPKQIKICFFTALAAGFCTHMYMLTHKLPNWDDVNCFANAGITSHVGRWMLDVLKNVPTQWSNPWINGSTAIFLLALVCCLIMAVLELKSVTSAVLLPFLVMTFPSAASTMAFMFTVDMYMAGLFMAVLAVYITRRFKYGFGAGVVLCILSLGTYQAYICFSITLFCICILQDALGKKSSKEIGIGIGKAVAVLAGSVLLYIPLCHLIFPEMSKSQYAGTGEMGQISIREIPVAVGRSCKRILEYFVVKPFSFVSRAEWMANILVCLLIGVIFILIVRKTRLWENKSCLAVSVLALVATPVGMAFIYVMSPKADFSMLMLYQYVLMYVLLLVLWEKFGRLRIPLAGSFGILLIVLLLFIGGSHYVVTGEAYFRMDMSKQRVDAYYNRVLARLESEGYVPGERFLIMGHSQDGDDRLLEPEHYFMEDEMYADFSGISPEYGILTSGVRENYMRIYFGLEVPYVSDAEKEKILAGEGFQNMPVYPQEGCVREIEGIWVIKISEAE